MTDPIADMLTRIRNAIRLKRPMVEMPYAKSKHAIANILEREGLLAGVEKAESERLPILRLILRYDNEGTPMIRQLRRISKPGQRVYVRKGGLPVVLSNYGIAIVSTSSGMMTNKEAHKRGIGGEVICEVF